MGIDTHKQFSLSGPIQLGSSRESTFLLERYVCLTKFGKIIGTLCIVKGDLLPYPVPGAEG